MRHGGAALTLLLLAVTLSACARPAAVDGIITLAVPSSPNSFDPRVATDEISQKVAQLVYDNLLTLDDRLNVVPGLAESWEQTDPLTYIVRLRPNVRFHDGHTLSADDVVYTFGSLIDPAFVSPRKGAYRLLDTVTAVDPLTVRFTLKEPFGSFPINLVMPVVPAGAGADLKSHPIGTGPYRLASYAVDDRIELRPFADYFGGAPANDGITLRVIPDDVMRGLELRQGAVDLIVNDLPPDVIAQMREDDEVDVVEAPGTDYAYIGFNMKDPLLADRRIRHAIGYAVDRRAIVDHLRRGLAEPAMGILPPVSWAFAPDAFQFTLDRDRAMRLLDEAGYPDPDGDGPLPRLHLTLKVSTNEFIRLQAAVLQEDLKRVGIALEVRSYEFATLYADVLKGNFQLFTLQWVGVSDPDMLRRVFHSAQAPPVGFNRGRYANADVDRLIDQATVETNPETRGQLYQQAQRLIAEDAPYISLWYKRNVAVFRKGVTGVRLSPSADFSFLRDVSEGTGNHEGTKGEH
ncbi:MAG: ABC transporter substrate-binding protein [Acidobacteria bacterium]|nr:ABC transporter substrate-binding protein [Acidobacteriota bacterium]